MVARFRWVGEYDLDARRRIALGKAGLRGDTRYIVLDNTDGLIVLVPAKTIPARESLVLDDPRVAEALHRGIEQATAGKLRRRERVATQRDD